MQVRISYFYQIRNFKKNMIPMSTAMSDPDWYHDWQGNDHTFIDRRGILNGLRLRPIIVQEHNGGVSCPCEHRDWTRCPLAKSYQEHLEQIDFDKMMKGISDFCEMYAKQENLKEEPIAVLIVYEAPNNPCSERGALIDYFNNHGVDCKELEYPIQKPDLKF